MGDVRSPGLTISWNWLFRRSRRTLDSCRCAESHPKTPVAPTPCLSPACADQEEVCLHPGLNTAPALVCLVPPCPGCLGHGRDLHSRKTAAIVRSLASVCIVQHTSSQVLLAKVLTFEQMSCAAMAALAADFPVRMSQQQADAPGHVPAPDLARCPVL